MPSPSVDSSQSSPSSPPIFTPDRLAITVTAILLAAATVSWLASYYYLMPLMMMAASGSSSEMMGGGVASIVSSLSISAIGFFEVVWIIGMAAMMFPAIIPVVLFYDRVKTKLETNPTLAKIAGTPLFLAGYLTMYAILGLGAYLAIFAAITLSMKFPALSVFAVIAPSAILIATGIYQFSSLKTKCLSQCVSPLGFFITRSRSGLHGAFEMGFSHGMFCVGCCWAYMLVMLAVGAMSIPIMLGLSGVIALEKVIIRGAVWFRRAVAIAFITLGILVAFFPAILSSLS